MLEKIISIENVGIFKNYKNSCSKSEDWNGSFKKENLIYAENGEGKTTLTTIFKSLKRKNSQILLEKKSLEVLDDKDEKIEIKIKGEEIYNFNNGNWNGRLKNIEIFDSNFVSENIYTGHAINHEHKKNLHSFIIGEKGIDISNRISMIKDERLDLKTKMNNLKSKINKSMPTKSKMDSESFIEFNLEENPLANDIENKIKAQKRKVKKIEDKKSLKRKNKFKKILIPEITLEEIENLLNKTTEDIDKTVAKKIEKHIKDNLDNQGEKWLKYGNDHLKDNDLCPFCNRDISRVDLVKAYKDYFSEEYSNLTEEINLRIKDIKQRFDKNHLYKIKENLNDNEHLIETWQQYLSENENMKFDYDELENEWNNFRTNLNNNLEKKKNDPVKKIDISSELKKSYQALSEVFRDGSKYNELVDNLNVKIKIEKENIEDQDLLKEKEKLVFLNTIKARKEKEVSEYCNDYLEYKKNRERLKEEKDKLREQLDEYTDELMRSYKKEINKYLKRFGVEFRIEDVAENYKGGSPNIDYGFKINNITIKNDKGYKCVLSEGEKSTLAFAFFIAKISLDEDLDSKIIVIDDPVSSLDISRITSTAQEISKLANKSKQIFILTHDLIFAQKVWEDRNKNLKTLKITHNKNHSNILHWEIDEDVIDDYISKYRSLTTFLENNEGDLDLICKTTREVLEGNLRLRFPNNFNFKKTLGAYIRTIKEAKENSEEPLSKISDDALEEIVDINKYSRSNHHSSVGTKSPNSINKSELKSYVRRTIDFCTGLY